MLMTHPALRRPVLICLQRWLEVKPLHQWYLPENQTSCKNLSTESPRRRLCDLGTRGTFIQPRCLCLHQTRSYAETESILLATLKHLQTSLLDTLVERCLTGTRSNKFTRAQRTAQLMSCTINGSNMKIPTFTVRVCVVMSSLFLRKDLGGGRHLAGWVWWEMTRAEVGKKHSSLWHQ